jgi:hypothetical protein
MFLVPNTDKNGRGVVEDTVLYFLFQMGLYESVLRLPLSTIVLGIVRSVASLPLKEVTAKSDRDDY